MTELDWHKVAEQIKRQALDMGFSAVGIADIDVSSEYPRFIQWLDKNYHGDMSYMERNLELRRAPNQLHPGTLRIVSVALDYLPPQARFAKDLADTSVGYISRYASGRDYHKLMRQRLKRLGESIKRDLPELDFRPFVDSAPVLERPLARNAGLGWIGKHSLALNKNSGSWFFIGELMVNLPLPVDPPHQGNCGTCQACISICPTGAIVEPYVVDSRRCISYLTIEHDGIIPEALRPLMGNRIYGCDDCQLVCPWNRDAPLTEESDFHHRYQSRQLDLLNLWHWDETTFLSNTQGSPIRRIGYRRWRRNLAIALGNAPASIEIINALKAGLGQIDEMVDQHILWAVSRQEQLSSQLGRQQQRLVRIVEKGLPRDA